MAICLDLGVNYARKLIHSVREFKDVVSRKYTLYLSKRVTNVDSGHFYPDSVLHLPIFLRDFTHLC